MPIDRELAHRLARSLEYPLSGDASREEAFTAAFDLAPIASPYVGDHLFGATANRHVFLAKVKSMFRAAGVEPGDELPDHLASVLRLAAVAPPSRELEELLADGALPVARKMLAALQEARSPYALELSAVVAALERGAAAAGRALEAKP
jgi:nitrate reductase delta subunit